MSPTRNADVTRRRRSAALRLPGWASHRSALTVIVLVVFGITSAVGAKRVGSVFWASHQGAAARAETDLPAAARAYRQAVDGSRDLKMAGTERDAAFDLAGVLADQGQEEEAAAVLRLKRGFVQVVPADAWEGPLGGNLYSPAATCWKHIELLPGESEIRIYASGTSAEGVQALMQVKLDEQVLSERFVTGELAPYSFSVSVPDRTRRRLGIHFLNDYYQAEPYVDRNLLIDRAEIVARRIASNRE